RKRSARRSPTARSRSFSHAFSNASRPAAVNTSPAVGSASPTSRSSFGSATSGPASSTTFQPICPIVSRPSSCRISTAARTIPAPGAGEVRIRVKACGICFSDDLVKDGGWPGLMYPRVPGHEVVGVIDEAGAGVTEWKKGDRVGVGWHGGHDFVCPSCRRGDFVTCANEAITGITRDGGYAQYMLARDEAVALLPDVFGGAAGGPWICAGI